MDDDREIHRIAPTEPDPAESARAAGLHYVDDRSPGIRRKRAGSGFAYITPRGHILRNVDELRRIKALAIPPAWTDVWICPDPNGHIQATGRDARGRKQYRYHSRWREVRDQTKYDKMIAFAEALPQIRQRIEKHLALRGLPRKKVLATVVKLLETTFIRVGNDEYAQQNNSFGLTTMQDHHVRINGSQVRFQFRGKSGIQHAIDLQDRRLAKIIQHCQDLPGEELFQYVDDEGNVRDVTSEDVNEYLRRIAGQDFTAKDFRTWAGTVLASMALQELDGCATQRQAKKNIVTAVEAVARKLGNTKAVCRKCYIHPAILDAYLDGTLIKSLRQRIRRRLSGEDGDLRPEEYSVLSLLQSRLDRENAKPKPPRKLRAAS